jgi:hypothetical protein
VYNTAENEEREAATRCCIELRWRVGDRSHCIDTARKGGRGDELMAGPGTSAVAGWVGSRSYRGGVAAVSGLRLQRCIEYKWGGGGRVLSSKRVKAP